MSNKLSHAQLQRLTYIDFCLEYYGQITRADLRQRFQTGLASCSRDLALYREMAPSNAILTHETKKYLRTKEFKPLFEHDPESILTSLSKGFGDGVSHGDTLSEICFDAIRLIHPKPQVIATIMRAIHSGSAIECSYESISSGTSFRTIIPHAIVNNGHRWHARAFDRNSKSFRDFVCSRFSSINETNLEVEDRELALNDDLWNSIVKLIIAPHKKLKHSKAIEMDFSMEDGELVLEVRAALAGYLLRHWNVDCSEESDSQGSEYHLLLKNRESLEQLSSLVIAPGFSSPKS